MITLIPRVSEKSYRLAGDNCYVFRVPLTANKQQIADAVAIQYGVKVADVRTLLVKGKAVAASRGKRRTPGVATRSSIKKAFVSLSEGTIELFREGAEA